MSEDVVEQSNADVLQAFEDAKSKGNEPNDSHPKETPSDNAPPKPGRKLEVEKPGEKQPEEPETPPSKPKMWAGKYKNPDELEAAYTQMQKELNATKQSVGPATKAMEALEKLQSAALTAKPDEFHSAVTEALGIAQGIKIDPTIFEPKQAIHLANVLGPAIKRQQELEERLARLEEGNDTDDARQAYEARYPHMANPEVKNEVAELVSNLRSEHPDGNVDLDELIARVVGTAFKAGLTSKAKAEAVESRDVHPAADDDAHSRAKPVTLAPDDPRTIVAAIFGDPQHGIEGIGETPPDILR